jgi:peptidoglycan/LPS O-acetylase OafA/YrhL
LYIFHFIVAASVLRHVLSLPGLHNLRPIMHYEAIRMVMLAALTFSAATLSWFLYERRLLQLKRFFPYTRALPNGLWCSRDDLQCAIQDQPRSPREAGANSVSSVSLSGSDESYGDSGA